MKARTLFPHPAALLTRHPAEFFRQMGATPPSAGKSPRLAGKIPLTRPTISRPLGNVPPRSGNVPRRLGTIPRLRGTFFRKMGNIPQRSRTFVPDLGNIPRRMGDIPRRLGNVPHRLGNIPNGSGTTLKPAITISRVFPQSNLWLIHGFHASTTQPSVLTAVGDIRPPKKSSPPKCNQPRKDL